MKKTESEQLEDQILKFQKGAKDLDEFTKEALKTIQEPIYYTFSKSDVMKIRKKVLVYVMCGVIIGSIILILIHTM